MSMISERAAHRMRSVPTYKPGRALAGHATSKLSANESVLGPGPAVISAISHASRGISSYPTESAFLNQLAQSLQITPEQLLISNGSDEICFLIAQTLLDSSSIVVVSDPAYQIDATVSLIAGSDIRRVPIVNGVHDVEAMIASAHGASVIWFPNPHNPTGTIATSTQIRKLISSVPEDCLVVLDEAYRDYISPGFEPDVLSLLDEFPNLLIQRTLSKSWALAGVRLGYAMGDPSLIAQLRRVRAPFSVNALALVAGSAALGRPAWKDMTVARIRAGRELFENFLTEIGVEFLPSQANFVTVRIQHEHINSVLAPLGISTRPGDDLGLPGWTRITIGWAPTMALVRQAIHNLVRNNNN